MSIKYTDLLPTTEIGCYCGNCSDYKTMVDCPECGGVFCVVCSEWCDDCGENVVY